MPDTSNLPSARLLFSKITQAYQNKIPKVIEVPDNNDATTLLLSYIKLSDKLI